ncbi:MAG: hypothetical protein WDN03_03965 [Rhizomicrobium sp.]
MKLDDNIFSVRRENQASEHLSLARVEIIYPWWFRKRIEDFTGINRERFTLPFTKLFEINPMHTSLKWTREIGTSKR